MIRRNFLVSLSAATLVGCKEPPATAAPSSDFVTAGEGITLQSVRQYATSDAIAGSSDVYYIVSFAFNNYFGTAFVPRIDHFVLEDDQKRRFLGADSGNANLIGLRNEGGSLVAGADRTYTIGFRVPHNTHAKLFYDATF